MENGTLKGQNNLQWNSSVAPMNFCSDVMIVKYDENDYYVSEKRADLNVYYALLEYRTHMCEHYLSIDTAQIVAEEMRKELLVTNPNCRIIMVDRADFIHIDIIIVKLADDDYFVTTQKTSWNTTAQFLLSCAYSSPHYTAIEFAQEAADKLLQTVIDKNPICKIYEYDIECFLNPVWEKSGAIKLLRDARGNVVCGLTKKGRAVSLPLEGEKKYQYIDIPRYRQRLEEELRRYEDRPGFDRYDYYNMGMRRGFEAAAGKNLAALRYGIYSAETELQSFADDPELFDYDIRFYSAFIEALEKAASIQKECVAPQLEWHVYILNLSGMNLPEFPKNGYIENLGSYTITGHDSAEYVPPPVCENYIYIVFINGKEDVNILKLRERLGFSGKQLVAFPKITSPNDLSKRTDAWRQEYIPNIIKAFFELNRKWLYEDNLINLSECIPELG